MKLPSVFTIFSVPSLVLLLAAGAEVRTASAALVTLTSPDNKWTFSSDEFGGFGEAVGGSFARRDFGAGLTGYAWAAGVLMTDGVTRQWLAGPGYGINNLVPMGAGDVVSDNTVGNVRTSVFNVPGFANIQVTLTQTAADSGIHQTYAIANNGASAANLSLVSFQDVDLDGATFLNDVITVASGTLNVSEGGRTVYFSPSPVGYVGYLAGHVPGGGVTGGLDSVGFGNFGIPAPDVNSFRDVSGGAPGADYDVNLDLTSDTASDVGYLFQNNVAIAAGGSVSLTFSHLGAPIPEPSVALLGLAALGCTLRRRR